MPQTKQQQFVAAALCGDLAKCKSLLATVGNNIDLHQAVNGVLTNDVEASLTPLMAGLLSRDIEVIELVLLRSIPVSGKSIDVNFRNNRNKTASHFIAELANHEFAELDSNLRSALLILARHGLDLFCSIRVDGAAPYKLFIKLRKADSAFAQQLLLANLEHCALDGDLAAAKQILQYAGLSPQLTTPLEFIAAQVKVNNLDVYGDSPIQLELVAHGLIAAGANVFEEASEYYQMPPYEMIKARDPLFAQKLLDFSLTIAARRGDGDRCAVLINEGANINAASFSDRVSAVYHYRQDSHLCIAQLIGKTPLLAAIEARDPEIVATLLSAGASVAFSGLELVYDDNTISGEQTVSPIVAAVIQQKLIVNAYPNNDADRNDERLEQLNKVEIIKELLMRCGIEFGTRSPEARRDYDRTVELLSKEEADEMVRVVDAKHQGEQKPHLELQNAAQTGDLEGARKAIRLKADMATTTRTVNSVEFHHKELTSLMLALLSNNPNMVSGLIDLGANVNQKDPHGWTALHVAIFTRQQLQNNRTLSSLDKLDQLERNRAIVASLLEAGANPNAGITSYDEYSGDTALHLALKFSLDIEISRLLIDNDANLYQPNLRAYSPLNCLRTADNEHAVAQQKLEAHYHATQQVFRARQAVQHDVLLKEHNVSKRIIAEMTAKLKLVEDTAAETKSVMYHQSATIMLLRSNLNRLQQRVYELQDKATLDKFQFGQLQTELTQAHGELAELMDRVDRQADAHVQLGALFESFSENSDLEQLKSSIKMIVKTVATDMRSLGIQTKLLDESFRALNNRIVQVGGVHDSTIQLKSDLENSLQQLNNLFDFVGTTLNITTLPSNYRSLSDKKDELTNFITKLADDLTKTQDSSNLLLDDVQRNLDDDVAGNRPSVRFGQLQTSFLNIQHQVGMIANESESLLKLTRLGEELQTTAGEIVKIKSEVERRNASINMMKDAHVAGINTDVVASEMATDQLYETAKDLQHRLTVLSDQLVNQINQEPKLCFMHNFIQATKQNAPEWGDVDYIALAGRLWAFYGDNLVGLKIVLQRQLNDKRYLGVKEFAELCNSRYLHRRHLVAHQQPQLRNAQQSLAFVSVAQAEDAGDAELLLEADASALTYRSDGEQVHHEDYPILEFLYDCGNGLKVDCEGQQLLYSTARPAGQLSDVFIDANFAEVRALNYRFSPSFETSYCEKRAKFFQSSSVNQIEIEIAPKDAHDITFVAEVFKLDLLAALKFKDLSVTRKKIINELLTNLDEHDFSLAGLKLALRTVIAGLDNKTHTADVRLRTIFQAYESRLNQYLELPAEISARDAAGIGVLAAGSIRQVFFAPPQNYQGRSEDQRQEHVAAPGLV